MVPKRLKTTVIEENIGVDLDLDQEQFLGYATKSSNNQRKIGKLDFIKISFCASKDIIKKVKRQLTEWERLFANHRSDKRFRIYKEYVNKSYN